MEFLLLLKVLHVYKDFDPPVQGGIEGFMARSCRYQRAWGDVSALTCSRSWRSRKVCHDGISVQEVGEWGRFLQAPIAPLFPLHMRRAQPDVTVLHMPNPTAEVAWLVAGCPGSLVVRYHSDVVRQARAMKVYAPIQHQVLRRAARILPTSSQYLETSATLAPHRERCQVVPLGIDVAAFQQPEGPQVAALHQEYGGSFVFFCGKHRYYKGLQVLVDAAAQIGAPVVIAGDGPERPALIEAASRKGVTVHFPGALSHAELVNHLHACAVFAFPSIARSEAFGMAIMEAHAAGCPVVATRLGTGVEFINLDGETGYNVEPNNPTALADGINALLANPAKAQEMGNAARKRIETEFGADVIAEREWQCYQESLACLPK